jgi:hypothetical protein
MSPASTRTSLPSIPVRLTHESRLPPLFSHSLVLASMRSSESTTSKKSPLLV